MKITRSQLQEYFTTRLPEVVELADAFTFHAFEIDSIEGDMLDVKVLPNRAADCATPEGIARELAAILDLPLKDATLPQYGDVSVAVTVMGINGVLGVEFSREEIREVFRRLQFRVEEDGETMLVTVPLPRTDVLLLEDVAEEVGQILGYDRIVPVELPMWDISCPTSDVGHDMSHMMAEQARFRGIERMKDELVAQGFTEVSTQSFAKKGDIELANPMDKTHPFLRTSLEENLQDALIRAKQYAPLVLAPGHKPKLFEVGTVFPKGGEYLELRMSERVPAWGESAGTVDNLSVAKLEDYGRDYRPTRYELGAYKPFSLYPFTTRDIAFWAPADTDEGFTKSLIQEKAGELLVRIDQFDRFEKEGRVSLAFRLVFQSFERTLTDEEVNGVMEKVSEALTAKDYEVR